MFRKISLAAVAALALTAAAVAPAAAGGGHGLVGMVATATACITAMDITGMVTGAIITLGNRSMSAEAATGRSSPNTARAPSTSATATSERA